MKHCTNCGAQGEDNAKFCIHCGTPFAEDAPKQETTFHQAQNPHGSYGGSGQSGPQQQRQQGSYQQQSYQQQSDQRGTYNTNNSRSYGGSSYGSNQYGASGGSGHGSYGANSRDGYGQSGYDSRRTGADSVFGIETRSIPLAIIFTIITCGIYGLYWMFKLNDEINQLAGETEATSGAMVIVFSLITCGIYHLYWLFKMGERCEKIKGYNGSLNVLYLVLGIFGFAIIAYCLIQDTINKNTF